MSGKLKGYVRAAIAMGAVAVVLLILFWGALVAAHAVPYAVIDENLNKSADRLSTRYTTDYGEPRHHGLLYMADRGTEVVMMQCIASTRPVAGRPLPAPDSAAMMVTLEGAMGNPDALRQALRADSVVSPVYPYERYWHGYLALLRPALAVTDYEGITIVNILLLCGALIWAAVATGRRLSWSLAGWFAAVMLLGAPWIIGGCLQFLPCFMLMALACGAAMTWPSLTRTLSRAVPLFFVIGALTAYFDFLTTPVITLGFPAALLAVAPNHNTPDGSPLRRTVWMCVGWGGGYFGLWGAKWVLAAAYGADILTDIVQAVGLRAGSVTGFPKLDALMGPLTLGCILLLAAAVVPLCWKRSMRPPLKALLVIALLPVAWTLLARNHTVVHYYFTWRAYLLPLFCAGTAFIISGKHWHPRVPQRYG